jgi:hypothetical protein
LLGFWFFMENWLGWMKSWWFWFGWSWAFWLILLGTKSPRSKAEGLAPQVALTGGADWAKKALFCIYFSTQHTSNAVVTN